MFLCYRIWLSCSKLPLFFHPRGLPAGHITMVYKRIMKIEISYHVFWTLDQASWTYQLASWIFHCWMPATQQSHPSQFIILQLISLIFIMSRFLFIFLSRSPLKLWAQASGTKAAGASFKEDSHIALVTPKG